MDRAISNRLARWWSRQPGAIRLFGMLVGGFFGSLFLACITRNLANDPPPPTSSALHFPLPTLQHPIPDINGIPPIPASAAPFIERVAYGMPNQILDWIHHGPLLTNPYTGLDWDGSPAALIELRRTLDPRLRDWTKGYHTRVSHANAGLQETYDMLVHKLAYLSFCQGDAAATTLLAEQESLNPFLKPLANASDWGWSRCAYTRVMMGVSSLTGPLDRPEEEDARMRDVVGWLRWFESVEEDVGGEVLRVCGRREWREKGRELVEVLEEIITAAYADQHRVLHAVSSIADKESAHLILHKLEPTLHSCHKSSNSTHCLLTHLHSLSTLTSQGTLHYPTWASSSPTPHDHTGRGETFLLRHPDTVFGALVPGSSKTELVGGRWYSRRTVLDGLMHDYLGAMITAMLAESAKAVLVGFEEVCQSESTRALTWGLDREGLPPQDMRDMGRAVRYLWGFGVEGPFARPVLGQREEGGRVGKSARLWYRWTVLNATCDFVHLHQAPPPPAAPRSSAKASDESRAKALVRAEVESAIWRYFDMGVEVQWKMRWIDANAGSWDATVLDLGSLARIGEGRVCKKRGEERRKG
ncbi:hypothetical protein Tdes44962_MAKER06515 [Teratosphaeria destructans]|uniref:Uncharacterized protein n=1 Tax=Teratosphaeria destructans TaxID=418781 RepID=A0A9W7T137_9PEZI|nr:hypothetical protein Tdes44962_MAKER06515 [Teratosphaeria destructans]